MNEEDKQLIESIRYEYNSSNASKLKSIGARYGFTSSSGCFCKAKNIIEYMTRFNVWYETTYPNE